MISLGLETNSVRVQLLRVNYHLDASKKLEMTIGNTYSVIAITAPNNETVVSNEASKAQIKL
jgi:hypothetical protein